jgi:hypothetical protein
MERLIKYKVKDWKRTGEWNKSPQHQKSLVSRLCIRVVAWRALPLIHRILKTSKQTTRRRRWDDLFNQGPKCSILFEYFAAKHEVFPPPRQGTLPRISIEDDTSAGPSSATAAQDNRRNSLVSISSSNTSNGRAHTRRADLFRGIHTKAAKLTLQRLWDIRQVLTDAEFEEFFRHEYSCDPNEGPAKSWQRAHLRVKGPWWVCNPKMAHLRRCGYVFWDRERFQGHNNVWVRQPVPIEDSKDYEDDGDEEEEVLGRVDLTTPGPSDAEPRMSTAAAARLQQAQREAQQQAQRRAVLIATPGPSEPRMSTAALARQLSQQNKEPDESPVQPTIIVQPPTPATSATPPKPETPATPALRSPVRFEKQGSLERDGLAMTSSSTASSRSPSTPKTAATPAARRQLFATPVKRTTSTGTTTPGAPNKRPRLSLGTCNVVELDDDDEDEIEFVEARRVKKNRH